MNLTIPEALARLARVVEEARATVEQLRPNVLAYHQGAAALSRIAEPGTPAGRRHVAAATFPDQIVATARAEADAQLRPESVTRDGVTTYFSKPTDPLAEQLAARLDGVRWDIAADLNRVRDQCFRDYDWISRSMRDLADQERQQGGLPTIAVHYHVVADFPEFLERLLMDRLRVA